MDAAAGGGIDQMRADTSANTSSGYKVPNTNNYVMGTTPANTASPFPVPPSRGPKFPPTAGEYFPNGMSPTQGPKMEDYPAGSDPSFGEMLVLYAKALKAWNTAVLEHQRYLRRTGQSPSASR